MSCPVPEWRKITAPLPPVPDGCVRWFGNNTAASILSCQNPTVVDTHYIDLPKIRSEHEELKESLRQLLPRWYPENASQVDAVLAYLRTKPYGKDIP